MPKSRAFAAAVLRAAFLGEALPIAAGQRWLSLHHGDPTSGDQATAEAVYPGYARLPLPAEAIELTDTTARNLAQQLFPHVTGGKTPCTHLGIGTERQGGGFLIYSFPITDEAGLPTTLTITAGRPPFFPVGSVTVEEV